MVVSNCIGHIVSPVLKYLREVAFSIVCCLRPEQNHRQQSTSFILGTLFSSHTHFISGIDLKESLLISVTGKVVTGKDQFSCGRFTVVPFEVSLHRSRCNASRTEVFLRISRVGRFLIWTTVSYPAQILAQIEVLKRLTKSDYQCRKKQVSSKTR